MRSLVEADIEAFNGDVSKIVVDESFAAEIDESPEAIGQTKLGPRLAAAADEAEIVRALVDWIEAAPFQRMYRGKPIGAPVRGWHEHLANYFWPSPDQDYRTVTARLHPLLNDARVLAAALQYGDWGLTQQDAAMDLAGRVFTWGGVPQSGYTAKQVQAVFQSALTGRLLDSAPMNSGWTKVAAFATDHSRDGQVIWDSRVAHSLVSHIDSVLDAKGFKQLPGFLDHIGWIPGRGERAIIHGGTNSVGQTSMASGVRSSQEAGSSGPSGTN